MGSTRGLSAQHCTPFLAQYETPIISLDQVSNHFLHQVVFNVLISESGSFETVSHLFEAVMQDYNEISQGYIDRLNSEDSLDPDIDVVEVLNILDRFFDMLRDIFRYYFRNR